MFTLSSSRHLIKSCWILRLHDTTKGRSDYCLPLRKIRTISRIYNQTSFSRRVCAVPKHHRQGSKVFALKASPVFVSRFVFQAFQEGLSSSPGCTALLVLLANHFLSEKFLERRASTRKWLSIGAEDSSVLMVGKRCHVRDIRNLAIDKRGTLKLASTSTFFLFTPIPFTDFATYGCLLSYAFKGMSLYHPEELVLIFERVRSKHRSLVVIPRYNLNLCRQFRYLMVPQCLKVSNNELLFHVPMMSRSRL